jgi:tetratricopeptide (TPR) repeat protein
MKRIIIIILVFTISKSFSNENKNDSIVNKKQIYKIEQNLIFIQNKTDSLAKKLIYIQLNDYKSIEVIDSVNNYYDNAWNKLIYFISAIGGIIIFVLPYLLSKLQTRELKLNKENLKDYVDSEINELEKRIKIFNKKEIENIREEIENINLDINSKQDKDISKVYGMTYFLLGLHQSKEENFNRATTSFIKSVESLIKAETPKNAINSLKNIRKLLKFNIEKGSKVSDNILKQIKNLISDLNETFPGQFDEIIAELEEILTTANNLKN